jgi:hypothetical protein
MRMIKRSQDFHDKSYYSDMMRGLLPLYPSGTMIAAAPKQGFFVRRIGD